MSCFQVCESCNKNLVTVAESFVKQRFPSMLGIAQENGYIEGVSIPRCWCCQTKFTAKSRAPVEVDKESFVSSLE